MSNEKLCGFPFTVRTNTVGYLWRFKLRGLRYRNYIVIIEHVRKITKNIKIPKSNFFSVRTVAIFFVDYIDLMR